MKRASKAGSRRAVLGVLAVVFGCVLLTDPAASQKLPGAEPWRPTTADSIRIWTDEAKAILESSRSQSLTLTQLHPPGFSPSWE